MAGADMEAVVSDLKRCPFCGKQPYEPVDTSYGCWAVACRDDNECAVQPRADGHTEAEAIAAWNTRADIRQGAAPSPELAEELEALERQANGYSEFHYRVPEELFGRILTALRSPPDEGLDVLRDCREVIAALVCKQCNAPSCEAARGFLAELDAYLQTKETSHEGE